MHHAKHYATLCDSARAPARNSGRAVGKSGHFMRISGRFMTARHGVTTARHGVTTARHGDNSARHGVMKISGHFTKIKCRFFGARLCFHAHARARMMLTLKNVALLAPRLIISLLEACFSGSGASSATFFGAGSASSATCFGASSASSATFFGVRQRARARATREADSVKTSQKTLFRC